MGAITRIEIGHHRLPLAPPFPAAWDPRPRTHFPATVVRVHDDAGHVGVGSGDTMYGFADFQSFFLGEDPLDLERHGSVLANVDFHDLRRFMETYGQEMGYSVAQVAMRAGHDPSVAARHYSGRVVETDRDLAQAVASLLTPTS